MSQPRGKTYDAYVGRIVYSPLKLEGEGETEEK